MKASAHSRPPKPAPALPRTCDDPQSGYGYFYTKTVTLVPGKAQMTIAHVMKNTRQEGHRHHRLLPQFPQPSAPASEHLAITSALLSWSAVEPFQPELVKLDGKTIR